jgi:hypothetical protein
MLRNGLPNAYNLFLLRRCKAGKSPAGSKMYDGKPEIRINAAEQIEVE